MLEECVLNNGRRVLSDPEVKRFLHDMVGDEGLNIIKSLKNKKITDEDLAENTGLKLNVVRKVLYKLYDHRLASYIRTKDKEIGWYIYTWELDLKRVADIIAERKKRMLDERARNLEFEENNTFFVCKNDNSKIPFEIASETNFRCPVCDGPMEYSDNKSIVSELKTEMSRLKKEVKNA